MAGFSITSPDLQRLGAKMGTVDIADAARRSAVIVGERLVPQLRTALERTGARREVVADVQVHDGHLSQLVMREPGSYGDVLVGVTGTSRSADEAEEAEWGSQHTAPGAWVRTTVAARRRDVLGMWGNELTRAVEAKLR